MYTTKKFNPKIVDANAYITIGDPYKDASTQLPSRWKGKGFQVQQFPVNSDNGNFSKLEYKSCPYAEMEKFSKSQPNRKLGFGTKDAFRSAEFTATIRTEQYRDLLRKEQFLMNKFRNQKAEEEIIERVERRAKGLPTCPEGRTEIKYLYDVGRTQVLNKCSHFTIFYFVEGFLIV
mmetsp:Transcript_19910/g.29464  ORF Transcript_19910/g.29464 Transcript_19910/m.29464 type:complete len:176 (+) Transcript_19910:47-574(+)